MSPHRTPQPAEHPGTEHTLAGLLARATHARTILIEGQSGAGKTNLATWLGARLGRPVVHLDDYYPGWEGLAAAGEMTATDVLHPTHPRFRRWDWDTNTPGAWVGVPAGPLIVEGCGVLTADTLAAARALGPVLSVAVMADEQVRARRALARDPGYAEFWDLWAAQERTHHATRPAADITIDGARMPLLVLSAVALRDTDGRFIHVRKKGSTGWILPGGKREVGESPLDTVVREVDEELGLRLDRAALELAGVFAAPAANEAATEVVCHIFSAATPLRGLPTVRAEIAEVMAVDPACPPEHLAPLSRLFFHFLAAGNTP